MRALGRQHTVANGPAPRAPARPLPERVETACKTSHQIVESPEQGKGIHVGDPNAAPRRNNFLFGFNRGAAAWRGNTAKPIPLTKGRGVRESSKANFFKMNPLRTLIQAEVFIRGLQPREAGGQEASPGGQPVIKTGASRGAGSAVTGVSQFESEQDFLEARTRKLTANCWDPGTWQIPNRKRSPGRRYTKECLWEK